MTLWPSVADERAIALHARLGKGNPPQWKSHGPLLATVFFFLTLLAIGAFSALFFSAHLVIAAICIVVAELLIQRSHFFGTGIESGLWVGAIASILFSLPRSGSVEAILVIALGAVVAKKKMAA